MKLITMTTTLTFACLLFCGLNAFSQPPLRIVCMGNSITQGKIDKTSKVITQLSYRPCLWEKLDSAGIDVDMVGYTNLWFDESVSNMAATPLSQYTGHDFDRDHDSYYGITSDGLLNGDASTVWTGSALPKLSDRLKSYTADIALLHIGTNDADNAVNTTVSNIEAIIDALRVSNPHVVVFVAKLITAWKPINAKVDQIAANKSTSSSPVIAVDLATGFVNDIANPNTTMTYDWVHPNPKGQKFMAERWFNAIVKQLNAATGLAQNLPRTIVEVYPSISNGNITIKNAENALVQVFSQSGQMVKTMKTNENSMLNVDLSALGNGMYIIRINQKGQMISRKIIIHKSVLAD